jgi:hypothetical protein
MDATRTGSPNSRRSSASDGAEASFERSLGTVPRSVAFEGSIDGTSPTQGAGVRLEQEQQNALFVLDVPFAFLSFGPSNLGEVSLGSGEAIAETYKVVVYDCDPPPRRRKR